MLEIARKLSEDIPMVRVDLYNVDGNIYVGEMTFSPGLFLRLEPVEWDYKMGEFIDLNKISQENII